MIAKVTIKGFKSLRDTAVDLGRFNVFIGPNGAGKSNLLEAIGLLGASAMGRVDDDTLLRRGVRPGVPALYKSSFKGQRLPAQIDLRADSQEEGTAYRVLLNNPLQEWEPSWSYFSESLEERHKRVAGRSHRSREPGDPHLGRVALELATRDPDSTSARFVRELQSYAIYTPTTQTLRGTVPDPQQREPIGLSGGRLPEAVLEVYRGTSPAERGAYFDLLGWVKRIRIAPSAEAPVAASVPTPRRVLELTDRYMAEERNILTAYDASEGSLIVLFAMVVGLHPNVPPVLAVDNVDHGLNPRLARAMVEQMCGWVLSRQDRQVLLTAHNPVLLDGLPLQNPNVRLFMVDRAINGETIIRQIEVTDVMLARAKEGWTLSRMWVAGHLGGVPDV